MWLSYQTTAIVAINCRHTWYRIDTTCRGLSHGSYDCHGLLGSVSMVFTIYGLWLFGSHLLLSATQARPKQAMHVSSYHYQRHLCGCWESQAEIHDMVVILPNKEVKPNWIAPTGMCRCATGLPLLCVQLEKVGEGLRTRLTELLFEKCTFH